MLKKQKNIVAIIGVSVCLFVFGFSFSALASTDVSLEAVGQGGLAIGTTVGFIDIVINLINAMLGLLGIISISLFLYGGYLYMLPGADGNADNVAKSKKLMKNAVIGLAIILLAGAIVNFIFYMLTGRLPGQGGGGGGDAGSDFGYEGGTGAFGSGIIETHYPLRNAQDVPRNTMIAITFKEPVAVSQIIEGGSNADCEDGSYSGAPGAPGVPGVIKEYTGEKGAGVFAIFHTQEDVYSHVTVGNKYQLLSQDKTPPHKVNVITKDCKTFVFQPTFLLGAGDKNVMYSVGIMGALNKLNGFPAFGNLANDGDFAYQWNFEVSTKLDVTPPTVTSVIPITSPNYDSTLFPRNYIIQVNFSEPVNPLSIAGSGTGFNSLIVSDPSRVNGTWAHGNGYKTSEFLSLVSCGTNSCGQTVYCLPAEKTLDVLVRSPLLAAQKNDLLPFAADLSSPGVVDMANNALNGNMNNVADGPYSTAATEYQDAYSFNNKTSAGTKDSVTWRFKTNNTVDLEPPIVTAYSPSANEEGVDPAQSLMASFSKILSATSVKPDSNYGDGFCGCTDTINNSDCKTGEICGAQNFCVNATSYERIACYTYSNTPDCKLSTGQKIEDVCKQQEHASIDQTLATANPRDYTWYTPTTVNVGTGEDEYSAVRVSHGVFLLNKAYQPRYGSGIKDITQNCYTPSGAPSCIVTQIGVDQFVPGEGDWITGTGTCDLTTTSLSSNSNVVASYVTPGKKNEVSNVKVYSWNKDANSIFNGTTLTQNFSFLKNLFSPNTYSLTLYIDRNDEATITDDEVYLVGANQITVISSTLAEPINETTQNIVLLSAGNFPQPSIIGNAPTAVPIRFGSDVGTATYDGIEGNTLMAVKNIAQAYEVGTPVQAYSQGSITTKKGPDEISEASFTWNTLTQPTKTFVYPLGNYNALKTLGQPISLTIEGLQPGHKLRLITVDQFIELDTAPTSKLQLSFK